MSKLKERGKRVAKQECNHTCYYASYIFFASNTSNTHQLSLPTRLWYPYMRWLSRKYKSHGARRKGNKLVEFRPSPPNPLY